MARTKHGPAPKPASRKPARAPRPAEPARRKSLPAPRAPRGLPDIGNSEQRLCWRFRHADSDGLWCFREAADDLGGMLSYLTKFESMTVREVFSGNGYPGKDYNIEEIPTRAAIDRLH